MSRSKLSSAYDGDDLLIGSNGNDRLYGNSGSDTLRGGAGADILDGGEFSDVVSYYTSSAGVTVNLADGICSGGDAQGDVLTNLEGINGSQFNDVLTGDGGALRGWGGNDILRGGSATLMDGGEGQDMVTYWASSSSGLTVNLQTESHMIRSRTSTALRATTRSSATAPLTS